MNKYTNQKEIKQHLDTLPILSENPFEIKLDNFRNKVGNKIYAVEAVHVIMQYAKDGKREPQVGFVFGTDESREILYFSRYGIEDEKGTYACNISKISLGTKCIEEMEVFKKLLKKDY